MRIVRKSTWTTIDRKTVHGLLVFFPFGLETTISSNMVDDYLLPEVAKRGCPPSLPRGLMPAAVPVLATPPCPRHLFQATTRGAAIPKLEYVPTTIPNTRAKAKARSTWPPIRNRTSTVRKVSPLVRMVRDNVWLMDLLTTEANGSLRKRRLFSRTRSKITIVSFME